MSKRQDDRTFIRDEVRRRCKAEDLIGFIIQVAEGQAIDLAPAGDGQQVPSIQDRVAATAMLLDYGWGKAIQPVVVKVGGRGGAAVPVSEMVARLYKN